MKINKQSGVGCNFMNEDNIVVASTWSYEDGNMDDGVGDSLGRTAMSAIIYDEDRESLLDGILDNFRLIRTSANIGAQWYISRYPRGEEYAAVGCSRDHAMYAISTLKLTDRVDDIVLKTTIKDLAKRPSIQYGWTFLQKIWLKALFSKGWSNVLALFMVPSFFVLRPLKKQLNTFMFFYYLWGIQAIKSKWAKKVIKKTMLPLFEKSNYVARLLCGDSITEEEFKSYIPTRSFRWTTRLDKTDRDMTLYPNDTPENNVELGLLHYLYNEQSKN